MRGFVFLAVLGIALVALPLPAAAPHIGGSAPHPFVALTGCPPGTRSMCTVEVAAASPDIVFFRFDIDADGDWDFPDQTGGGQLGKWTTNTAVTRRFSGFSLGVCVQGWDGTSTARVRGEDVPHGPRGCNAFAEFLPETWRRDSADRILCVRLYVPSWLNHRDFSPRGAEVEGLPAEFWPFRDCWSGPRPWTFLVDRVELTRLLRPGSHWVHLLVPWAGMSFTAADIVTIR